MRRLFSTLIRGFRKELYAHSDAVSLSADPAKTSLIIGWKSSTSLDPESLHIGFRDNPAMKDQIYEIIKSNLINSDYYKSLASCWPDGHMHIADGRVLTAFGRTPEPDDILATVLVREGKMILSSLQQMPTHRLLTVNGLFELPAELDKILE